MALTSLVRTHVQKTPVAQTSTTHSLIIPMEPFHHRHTAPVAPWPQVEQLHAHPASLNRVDITVVGDLYPPFGCFDQRRRLVKPSSVQRDREVS